MFEPALKAGKLQANEKQMESMKKEEEAKKADSIVRERRNTTDLTFN